MSGKIYVIGDLHFSHKNMALHRGFESTEQHDNTIIDNWNKTINKKDTVYILGDITMEKSTPYYLLDKLNGFKKVVLGNHDKPQHVKELLKYVNSVCSSFKIKDCILTHIPIHPRELDRYRKNIHAHLHDVAILDDRYRCVSCEQIGYKPIELSSIIN